MADEKRATFGVSIQPVLLEAIDAHIGNEDRSSYIRRLVTADLQAAGKLPGSPIAEVVEMAREAVGVVGPEKVRAALRRLGAGKLEQTAGEKAA